MYLGIIFKMLISLFLAVLYNVGLLWIMPPEYLYEATYQL